MQLGRELRPAIRSSLLTGITQLRLSTAGIWWLLETTAFFFLEFEFEALTLIFVLLIHIFKQQHVASDTTWFAGINKELELLEKYSNAVEESPKCSTTV